MLTDQTEVTFESLPDLWKLISVPEIITPTAGFWGIDREIQELRAQDLHRLVSSPAGCGAWAKLRASSVVFSDTLHNK